MFLENWKPSQNADIDGSIIFKADDRNERVICEIAGEVVSSYFPNHTLTASQIRTLILDHEDMFREIVSTKYSGGEWLPEIRYGSVIRRVCITIDDLRAAARPLTDGCLRVHAGAGFQRPFG
jgi:hypothetical protein